MLRRQRSFVRDDSFFVVTFGSPINTGEPKRTPHWGTDMDQNLDLVRSEIEKTQRALCLEHNAELAPTLPESKLGYAHSTKGRQPVKGLRHLPEGAR